MAEKWCYRLFGHEFGPVSFDELKSLADAGGISSGDEVCVADSDQWVAAGSVGKLGLELSESSATAATIDLADPVSAAGADDWYCMLSGHELGPIGFEELAEFAFQRQISADDDVKLGATGKWRRAGSIGRLMAIFPYEAAHRQIPDKKEKTAPVPQEPTPAPVSTAATAAPKAGPDPAEVQAAALAEARRAYAAADQAAKSQIAWGFAPNVDPSWWGWIGGVEYGPVNLLQVLDWAVSGQMNPSDFVKNGMYSQYVPASNIPGLFAAAQLLVQANQALKAAESAPVVMPSVEAASPPTKPVVLPAPLSPTATVTKAATVTTNIEAKQPLSSPSVSVPTTASATSISAQSASAPSGVAPTADSKTSTKKSSGTLDTVTSESGSKAASATAAQTPAPTTARAVAAREPVKPAAAPPAASSTIASKPMTSSFSGGGMSSSMSSPPARPYTSPPKPAARPSISIPKFSFSEMLQSPAAKGGAAALVVVLLILGWSFLPKSSAKDVERYRSMKLLLDDIRKARASKQTDYKELISRANKLTEMYAKPLNDEANIQYPEKQALLWAVRDDLPRMIKADLSVESQLEKNFEARLKEAATLLKIKD